MSKERPKAVATGTLAHIGINADCYVLSNGVRVLSQRGILRAIGAAESTAFDRFLARLPNKNMVLALPPEIEFELPGGGTAIGRPAEWFIDLLKAYKAAWRADALHASQVKLAKTADAMLDALAGVAIVALIDEATGYQTVREHGALARIFERLLLVNAAKWVKFWDDDLIASLCKTYGIRRVGKGCPAPMMGVIGWIHSVVLGTEVHEETKRRNPRGPNRKKHHQFFTDELKGLVKEDQMIIKVLSDQSRSKDEFKARLLAHYRKEAFQLSFEP